MPESIKKETLVQVSSCEFCEISKNTFLTEHPWWLFLFINAFFKCYSFITSGLIQRQKTISNRSSHRRCSVKRGVLKKLAKLSGKHMCQSLSLQVYSKRDSDRDIERNFVKKETLTQVFSS